MLCSCRGVGFRLFVGRLRASIMTCSSASRVGFSEQSHSRSEDANRDFREEWSRFWGLSGRRAGRRCAPRARFCSFTFLIALKKSFLGVFVNVFSTFVAANVFMSCRQWANSLRFGRGNPMPFNRWRSPRGDVGANYFCTPFDSSFLRSRAISVSGLGKDFA